MLYHARHYEEALQQLDKTLELDQNYAVTRWILGLANRQLGRCGIAIAEGEKAATLSRDAPLTRSALAQTYALAGRTDDARIILKELKGFGSQRYVSPYFIAGIHAALQENDSALDCLKSAYQQKSHWLLYLHFDPAMEQLRSDPRSQDLLDSIGLQVKLPPAVER